MLPVQLIFLAICCGASFNNLILNPSIPVGAGSQVWVSFRLYFTGVKACHGYDLARSFFTLRQFLFFFWRVGPQNMPKTFWCRSWEIVKDKCKVTPVTEFRSISLVTSIILFFSSVCPPWLHSLLFPDSLFSVKTYDWEAISKLDFWLDDWIN